MPLVYAHELVNEYKMYFEMAAILAISLCGSPNYGVKLRAFIFDSVMDLHCGYTEKKIMQLWITFLKL